MSRRALVGLISLALVVGACAGDGSGADTTSATPGEDGTATTQVVDNTEAPDTTEAPPDTEAETDDGPTVGLDDIPQECIDALVAYLQDIEPVVADVDWDTATMDVFEDLATELEPATTEFEEGTASSECDDIDVDATDEESFDYMIDLAEQEAPGTVGYLEMIRDFAGGFTGESDIEVSGDCETDIQTLQAIVDEGGSMQERSLADVGTIGNLITSITTNCSQERSFEFLGQEDVTSFMGG